MSENKKAVQLGEGVADNIKQAANQELSAIGKMLIGVFANFAKEKIQGINLDELFSKKNEEELVALWSNQLAEKSLIPKGYAGLPEELLIANMHQEGYLDGLYAGYALAMMALVDNDAPKDLILSVRDEIRPNLIGHHFNNRDEFYKRYKDEKYSWVDKADKSNNNQEQSENIVMNKKE